MSNVGLIVAQLILFKCKHYFTFRSGQMSLDIIRNIIHIIYSTVYIVSYIYFDVILGCCSLFIAHGFLACKNGTPHVSRTSRDERSAVIKTDITLNQ